MASVTRALVMGMIMCLHILGEERVFGHNHHWLLVELTKEVLGHILLVDNEAEHVVAEPAVGHDEASTETVVSSPAVFHLPLHRLAVLVQVYGGEGHGVGRAAVEGFDALGLVHAEGDAEGLYRP